MMLKKNKKFFIASCIVILLPMFAGILIMGSVASTGGNTILEETARPIDTAANYLQ